MLGKIKMGNKFTWTSFYMELATTLLIYKKQRRMEEF